MGNRKQILVSVGNEETSLSDTSSITIDTVSFYSHVRQLHWNDKFACRRAPRNSTTMRVNLAAIFRYTPCYDTRDVVYNDRVR